MVSMATASYQQALKHGMGHVEAWNSSAVDWTMAAIVSPLGDSSCGELPGLGHPCSITELQPPSNQPPESSVAQVVLNQSHTCVKAGRSSVSEHWQFKSGMLCSIPIGFLVFTSLS